MGRPADCFGAYSSKGARDIVLMGAEGQACVTVDPHSGHDPDATAKTVAAVTGELRGAFKLP